MKKSLLLSLLLSFQWVAAAGISVGDDLETTLTKLGKPIGTIDLREKTLLLYPEGEIVLKDNAVVEIDLMSDAEFEAEQERLKIEREEWLIEQARRQELHAKEGEAILKAKRGSTAFASLPAKDRVDYWRSFQIRYPSSDVSEDLSRALESYDTELTELRNQQQLAQLQARVSRAEQEAASARLETEKLKAEAERTRNTRYYYNPVVTPRYVYRPPTVTILTNDNCATTQQPQRAQRPDYWKFRNYNPNGTAERIASILHERKN